MNKTPILFILVLGLILNGCHTKNEQPEVSNVPTEVPTLLGQKPPGLTPEPFAPGMVTTEYYEYGCTFSPDMSEFYFIRDGGVLAESTFVMYQLIDTSWQESVISPRVGQAMISPDGKTMHLGRRYKERTETGWSERKLLEAPFKDQRIMRMTSSANGTYYFDTYDENNLEFPIRYSRVVDGAYEEPKALSENINTGTYLSHPYIAPDESYLIWDAKREGGYGDSDLYISFKQQDHSWGEAINLGDKINTAAWEAAASVSPNGKYLFFNRNVGSDNYENVDIFWVDMKVVEAFRPKERI